MITQNRLKELFSYNTETGVFTRLIYKHYNAKAGDIAGSLDSRGYLNIAIDGFQYKSHNLAWLYVTNEWPEYIDHENHIKHDNRFCNLKSVTHKENLCNQLRSKANTSGVTGVYWDKQIKRFRARIKVNQKYIALGCYGNIEDAAKARKEAEIKYNFHENHGKLLAQIV